MINEAKTSLYFPPFLKENKIQNWIETYVVENYL